MIDERRKKYRVAFWISVGIAVVGYLLTKADSSPLVLAGAGLLLAHYPIFVYACIQLALAKGYHWALGLIGLFTWIGFGVLLFVVPDKERSQFG